MIRFDRQKIKRKHTKLTIIYVLIFSAFIFIFIPEYLIKKSKNIFEKSIYEIENNDSLPANKDFVAFSYLKTAKLFPFYKEKSEKTELEHINRYFEAYKKQCNALKYQASSDLNLKSDTFTQEEYLNAIKEKIGEKYLQKFCRQWRILFKKARYRGYGACKLCAQKK